MNARLIFEAFRPKTLTAAVVPVVVATAIVHFEGFEVHWMLSLGALLSATFIQIGTNLFNDALDFEKGADTEKRLGPRRITQSGVAAAVVKRWAIFAFALAIAFAIPLVFAGGWPIVGVGIISLLCGYVYTGGPFPLAYKGLGDLFVLLFFGLVATAGTYYLHTGTVSLNVLIAGLQIGLMATVLIAINNLRDRLTDQQAGKWTLAARFGVKFSCFEIGFLYLLAFSLHYHWAFNTGSSGILIVVPAFILALSIVREIFQWSKKTDFNQLLHRSALTHLIYGISLSALLWMK